MNESSLHLSRAREHQEELRRRAAAHRRLRRAKAAPTPGPESSRDNGRAMSLENVEIVRQSFDVFARGGPEDALGYFDSEIEWTTTDGYIDAATYRGHEGVLRYYRTLAGEFDGFRIEPLEFIDAGEQVVVSVRISGRGKVSGAPVELRLTGVSSLREGKIMRIRNYQDKAEALEAAGLRE